jgi:hypothetical protein
MRDIFKRFEPREADWDKFFAMEYKGCTILAGVGNRPEAHVDNVFIVERDGSSFIVGLDDSKSCGYRQSLPNGLEDAIGYVDWLTRER